MLCFALLSFALLCFAMLCFALLCFALTFHFGAEEPGPGGSRNPGGDGSPRNQGPGGIFKGKAKETARGHRGTWPARGPEAAWAARASGRHCFGKQLEPLIGKPNWGITLSKEVRHGLSPRLFPQRFGHGSMEMPVVLCELHANPFARTHIPCSCKLAWARHDSFKVLQALLKSKL